MREAHSDGHFARVRRLSVAYLLCGLQQYEARKVFRVVLDSLGNDLSPIPYGGAIAGNRGMSFVTPRQYFAHTPCRIFCGQPPDVGMLAKKTLSLRYRHRVGGTSANV